MKAATAISIVPAWSQGSVDTASPLGWQGPPPPNILGARRGIGNQPSRLSIVGEARHGRCPVPKTLAEIPLVKSAVDAPCCSCSGPLMADFVAKRHQHTV